MPLGKTSAVVGLLFVAACNSVTVGGGSGGPVTGSAGPVSTQGTVELKRCEAPVAAVALSTQQAGTTLVQFGLPGNALPAMRLITQQSNCFRVVNRDAGLEAAQTERALQQQGQLKSGANFGGGQIVAADYTIMVEVLVNNPSAGGAGIGAALLNFIPYVGGLAGAVAGGVRTQEAQVLLTIIDNRSSVQVASVTGKASGTSFSLGGAGGGFGGSTLALGGAGGFENTAQGKVVMGAMIDATNQLVPQVSGLGKR